MKRTLRNVKVEVSLQIRTSSDQYDTVFLCRGFLNLGETVLKILLVRVNQIAVVHIAGVVFNAKLLLDVVVELVCSQKCKNLRNLTSEAKANIALEAIDKILYQLDKTLVRVFLTDDLLYIFMGSVVKVFAEVHDENITIAAMLPIISVKMLGETINGKCISFTLHTCTVIVDEFPRKHGYQRIVAQASLYDALSEGHTLNVANLATLKYIKLEEPFRAWNFLLRRSVNVLERFNGLFAK